MTEAKSLRVLQISAFFPSHGGGIEVVAGQLAKRLGPLCKDYIWMAGGVESELPSQDSFSDVSLIRAKSIDFFEKKFGVPLPVWSPGSFLKLFRAVGEVDIVHIHDYLYPASVLGFIFARLRQKKIIITQHIGKIEYKNRFMRRLLSILNLHLGVRVLSNAHKVVFVSRTVYEYFLTCGLSANISEIIVNGVDRSVFWPVTTKSKNDKVLDVIFVGRFVEKKGIQLIQGCADIKGIRWTFVGKGPLSPLTWQIPPSSFTLLQDLNSQQLAEIYRNSDLLVLPSFGEGFPLVIQESLSCGTPVVVGDEVAAAFDDIDWNCVYVVNLRDRDSATAYLRKFLLSLRDNPESLLDARKHASLLADQWSWDACAERYMEILMSMSSPQSSS